MRDSAQNAMLNSFLAAPDMLLSYNFTGLSLDKPTAYIYTRTGGKKLDNGRRLAYFQMHHDTIHAFQDKVAREGYADGTRAEDRQLLYIVVRDDSEIDAEVDAFFRARSIRELDSQATARQYAVAAVCLSVLEHSSLVISLPLFRRGPNERSRHSTVERRRESSGGRQGQLFRVRYEPNFSSNLFSPLTLCSTRAQGRSGLERRRRCADIARTA